MENIKNRDTEAKTEENANSQEMEEKNKRKDEIGEVIIKDEQKQKEVETGGENGSDNKIKIKVNKFDSVDASAVDETDAIKLGRVFGNSPHHQAHKPVEDDILKEREVVVPSATKEDEDMRRMVLIDQEDIYSNTRPRRGICLIIENDMFHTNLGLSKRKGSTIDRRLMINTFTKLEFEVRVYENLPTRDILKMLEKTSLEDHTKYDMFAVVILSHGNEGILYGYDSAYPAHKIWEPFTADKCASLIGKPKLFFIQACQGNKMDNGVAVVKETPGGRTSTDSFASYRTPLHADFLLAHSTVSGFYSWRNTVQGSWFMQVLGSALQANHKTHDLLTILTKVNKVVAHEYESNSSRSEFNNKKQTPFIYSTLTHKLVLQSK